MNVQRFRKCLYRGQQALLKATNKQPRRRLRSPRFSAQSQLTSAAIFIQQGRQAEVGSILGEPFNVLLQNLPLRKSATDLPEIVFQATHHHVIEHLWRYFYPSAEPLRIKQL